MTTYVGNPPKSTTNLILPLEYSAPRQNLVINSDFNVNQRSYTSGSALALRAFGYDRWYADIENTTVTLSGVVATLDNTAGSTDGIITQAVEGESLIPGKTYTLSWKGSAEGSVYYGNGGALNWQASPISFVASSAGGAIGEYITFKGDGVTLYEVKLEEGNSVTPWEKPDVSTELIRCKRYFQGIEYNTYTYYLAGRDGTAAVMNLERFPVAMAASPTYYGKSSSPAVTVTSVFDNIAKTTTGAITATHWNGSPVQGGAYITGGMSSLPNAMFHFTVSVDCTVYFEAEL